MTKQQHQLQRRRERERAQRLSETAEQREERQENLTISYPEKIRISIRAGGHFSLKKILQIKLSVTIEVS